MAGLLLAPASTVVAKHDGKTHSMTTEVVSTDTAAKTITIKDENGETKTAPVLKKAVSKLSDLKAGDKVTLTCLDNENGEHQGVSAIKLAKK